jgi:hypothetical protein
MSKLREFAEQKRFFFFAGVWTDQARNHLG